MNHAKINKLLEEQLQLLSQRSKDCLDDLELAALSEVMIGLVRLQMEL